MRLIIVESPVKSKTIQCFLNNKEYEVLPSYGHVRDLPKRELGVDVEHNFKPKYVVFRENRKRVADLRKKAAKSDLVYFATDEDREGEAIAWHLEQIFKLPKEKVKRITFHEITKNAVLKSLENPRSIDLNMVNAQQSRRVLDRLVGYKLSPFLWKKVARGLSAGRVQSPALRLIVEREREIEKFKPQEYWTVIATLRKTKNQKLVLDKVEGLKTKNLEFKAQLIKKDGKAIPKLGIGTKNEADKILKDLEGAEYKVLKVERREVKKHPLPPFTTSTLQQTANSKLGFSAKQTMMLAQQLYEGLELEKGKSVGLITYMRTDSVKLSEKFLNEAKKFIEREFGKNYYPGEPRQFKTKSKTAQEAHEAIRPTNVNLEPENIRQYLNDQQFKLYQLIWQRALACQMKEALIDSTIVDIITSKPNTQDLEPKYIFRSTGSVIKFDGFLRIYPMKTEENILPLLKVNELLNLIKLETIQHFTQPPPRYTEASLVKALEKYGIGRPSTYAPIISAIQDRNYVVKEERKLKPTEIGILVNDVLVKHFPKIVDFQFTAHMEKDLDKIARGKIDWVSVIREFYQPFIKNLKEKEEEISKKELTEEKAGEICPKCGSPMVIKLGRYGKFLACSNYPKCKFTKLLSSSAGSSEPPISEPETTNEKCPKCGSYLVIKMGRYGKFLACSNYPKCKFTKPIIKSTGVKCPQCGKGEIIEKRTKRGRIFYGCSNYPQCKFALWSKPTGEKCPKCGSLLVYAKDDKVKCSNKDCDFEK